MTTEVENETLCAECTQQVSEDAQNDTEGFNCYLCNDILCDKHQTRCRTCGTVYCAKSECMWRLNCVLCDTTCCQVCCGTDDKNTFTFFRCPLCDYFRKRPHVDLKDSDRTMLLRHVQYQSKVRQLLHWIFHSDTSWRDAVLEAISLEKKTILAFAHDLQPLISKKHYAKLNSRERSQWRFIRDIKAFQRAVM